MKISSSPPSFGQLLSFLSRSGLRGSADLVHLIEITISEHLCRNTNHAAEDVPVALDGTLKDLQTDYVDLYLVSLQEYQPSIFF